MSTGLEVRKTEPDSDQMLSLRRLIIEIINFLDERLRVPEEREVLKALTNVSLEKENYIYQKPNVPPKEDTFLLAVSSIRKKALIPIKEAIVFASSNFRWNIDKGSFYDKNSNIGQEYFGGNMNTELVGPKNGNYWSADCRLGLFLLEPEIFYKDHKHEAPELYINLTNGTYWRFEDKVWTEKKSASIIYNKPERIHAMKVNNQPFLSVWCWPYNSSKKCIVVNR